MIDYRDNTPVLIPELRNRVLSSKPRKAGVYPSTFVTMCERQLAIMIKNNFGTQPDLEGKLNFTFGDVVETAVEAFLREHNIKILARNYSIKLASEGFTSQNGRIDFVLELPDKTVVVADVKKMEINRFNKFLKHGTETEEAAKFQIMQYLHTMNEYNPRGNPSNVTAPKYGMIIGVCLAPVDIMDMIFKYNSLWLASYDERKFRIDKVLAMSESSDTEIADFSLPARPFDRESKQCRYCPVPDLCWKPGQKNLYSNDFSPEEIAELRIAYKKLLAADEKQASFKNLQRLAKTEIDKILEKHAAKSLYVRFTDGKLSARIASGTSTKVNEKWLIEHHAEIYRQSYYDEFWSRLYTTAELYDKNNISADVEGEESQ